MFKTVVGWVVFKNVLWDGWCLRMCCGMGGVEGFGLDLLSHRDTYPCGKCAISGCH